MVYNYIGKGSVKTHLYSLNTQNFLNQLMVKNTKLIFLSWNVATSVVNSSYLCLQSKLYIV